MTSNRLGRLRRLGLNELGRRPEEAFGQFLPRDHVLPPPARGRISAEDGPVNLLSTEGGMRGEALESALIHDKELRAETVFSELPRDHQRAVLDQLARRDNDLKAVFEARLSALDLDRDVLAVGKTMNHCVQTSVEER